MVIIILFFLALEGIFSQRHGEEQLVKMYDCLCVINNARVLFKQDLFLKHFIPTSEC